MNMENEPNNNEGPVCSCGRPDLYLESLKLKEKEVEAENGPNETRPAGDGDVSQETEKAP
jgi:hypothetical protein